MDTKLYMQITPPYIRLVSHVGFSHSLGIDLYFKRMTLTVKLTVNHDYYYLFVIVVNLTKKERNLLYMWSAFLFSSLLFSSRTLTIINGCGGKNSK